MNPEAGASDLQAVERLKSARERILAELRKVIVGQDEVVEQLLIALFAGGHCLLVGVPGLAKTLLISHAWRACSTCSFNRIQFTPDLMPSDITGTEILEEDRATGQRRVPLRARARSSPTSSWPTRSTARRPRRRRRCCRRCRRTRSPPAAQTFQLDAPFFVLATQNPIEQEGTYPLPEAQLDRFMFNVLVDYPTPSEEERIVATTTAAYEATLETRARRRRTSSSCRSSCAACRSAEHVVRYAVRLARATRARPARRRRARVRAASGCRWGAGPRASQYLVLGAKTRAVLRGRFAPGIEDVRAVAPAGAAPPHRHQLHRRGRGREARAHRPGAAPERPDGVAEPRWPSAPSRNSSARSASTPPPPSRSATSSARASSSRRTRWRSSSTARRRRSRSGSSAACSRSAARSRWSSWRCARPRTGGLYVFIRDAFGDAWAFAFGWANLWVIKPTLIAAITIVFAEYFCDAAGPAARRAAAGGLRRHPAADRRERAGRAAGRRHRRRCFTTLKLLGIAALCVAAFLLPHAGAPRRAAAAAAARGARRCGWPWRWR